MNKKGKRVDRFAPTFVDIIPKQLEGGKLYVCLRYRTVTHLCACGCGVEVNTPLHPTGWAISYDGVALSLSPSVGNWGENCRSHYVIEENAVRWSRSWSRAEILDERVARRRDIQAYFDGAEGVDVEGDGERAHKGGRWVRSMSAAWARIRRSLAWRGR